MSTREEMREALRDELRTKPSWALFLAGIICFLPYLLVKAGKLCEFIMAELGGRWSGSGPA